MNFTLDIQERPEMEAAHRRQERPDGEVRRAESRALPRSRKPPRATGPRAHLRLERLRHPGPGLQARGEHVHLGGEGEEESRGQTRLGHRVKGSLQDRVFNPRY